MSINPEIDPVAPTVAEEVAPTVAEEGVPEPIVEAVTEEYSADWKEEGMSIDVASLEEITEVKLDDFLIVKSNESVSLANKIRLGNIVSSVNAATKDSGGDVDYQPQIDIVNYLPINSVRIGAGHNHLSIASTGGIYAAICFDLAANRQNNKLLSVEPSTSINFRVIDRNDTDIQKIGSTVLNHTIFDHGGKLSNLVGQADLAVHRLYATEEGYVVQLGQRAYTTLAVAKRDLDVDLCNFIIAKSRLAT